MIPLTAVATSRPTASPWMASLYAGLATAVAGVITSLLVQMEIPWLYILGHLLIGAGPVVGYQLATGKFGQWKPVILGLIGAIVPFLSVILWPILVGIGMKNQSVLRLLLGSIIGAVLAILVFLTLGNFIGQDPKWFATGYTVAAAFWGGSLGAAMVAWGKDAEGAA
jgi:hypothetical protein